MKHSNGFVRVRVVRVPVLFVPSNVRANPEHLNPNLAVFCCAGVANLATGEFEANHPASARSKHTPGGPNRWVCSPLALCAFRSAGMWFQSKLESSPRSDSAGRIAADLKRSRETVCTNLGKLEAGNYIAPSAGAGHAYSYTVTWTGEPALRASFSCRIHSVGI